MKNINRWYHIKMGLLLIIIAVSAMACADSNSDDSGPVIITQSTDLLNGIWTGEYGTDGIWILFLLKDGDIYATDANGSIFNGTYTYGKPGDVFTAAIEGSNGTIDISGTATEQNRMEVTYTTSNGDTGNALLQFDDEYNTAASFELLSGQWTSDDSSYVIDAQGGFTGTFMGTCNITGTFSIIDPEHNLYVLDADLTGCDHDGQFNGLAFLWPKNGIQNSSLMAIATDDQQSKMIKIVGDRQ